MELGEGKEWEAGMESAFLGSLGKAEGWGRRVVFGSSEGLA